MDLEEFKHVRDAFIDRKAGDLALRQWIPTQIEGDSPSQFWRSLANRAPEPEIDVDFANERPWWDTYPSGDHCLLAHIEVPEARIDPDDESNHDVRLLASATEVMERKEKARQNRLRREQEKRTRPAILTVEQQTAHMRMQQQQAEERLKPKANIYLRPAVPADVVPILNVYNYYVTDTVKAHEFNVRTRIQMAGRIDDITSRGLPWIVAVHRKNNRRQQQQLAYETENIVGFANIDG